MISKVSRLSSVALVLVASAAWQGCSESRDRGGYLEDDLQETGTEQPDATPAPVPSSLPSTPSDAGTPTTTEPIEECAGSSVGAELTRLPADIVWVVDNSNSMADEIAAVRAGINAFASHLASSGIDYRLIMLAKRGTGASGRLWPVCVPEPLAGPNCGDSDRFFHADFAQEGIKSTQPLEQLLGSLAQTACYRPGDAGGRGGTPWQDKLRPEASKAIVVVSDDNSRLSANAFLNTPGGSLANISGGSSACTIPPGLKQPYWNGMFDRLVVHAMVGQTGATYRDLAQQTGGLVADITQAGGAESPAWNAFFAGVATEVVTTSEVSCKVAIPAAPEGQTLDPERVNVAVSSNDTPGSKRTIPRVASAEACGSDAGWYYDDPTAPTEVGLCPAACAEMNAVADAAVRGADVIFGCATEVIVN